MLALEPGKGKVRTLAGGELNGATEQNGTREGPMCEKSIVWDQRKMCGIKGRESLSKLEA